MTSSRLPGKVLLEADGKPMLKHLTDRLKKVPSIDEIVVATTINSTDDALVDFANNESISYNRGSENDVMERVINAAKSAFADIIVEITGQSYTIALSPQKNNYIDSYDKAEHFSNISEYALSCMYFNHFISMLDAFILARKFGGKVMLNSSTVYDKKGYLDPMGIRVDLIVKLWN